MQNKTTLIQLPFTTLGQYMTWAYSKHSQAHSINWLSYNMVK